MSDDVAADWTPGPWRYEPKTKVLVPRVVSDSGLVVAVRSRRPEADARLMAASPEMFDALANLYHRTIVGTEEQRHGALNEAWRVLVKARASSGDPE